MKSLHPALIGSMALSLALAGCLATPTAPVSQPSMDRLDDQVVNGEQMTKTKLTMAVVDKSADEAKGYRVNYIRVLDWDKVRATLYKVKEDPATPGTYIKDTAFTEIFRDKNATVSSSDLQRSAVVTLPNLTPAPGYAVRVDLIKTVNGGERIVATGANAGTGGAGFAIAEGPNAVTVTLALTSNGEAIVNVPEPGISTSLSTAVSTQSKMSIVRYAGTTIPNTTATNALNAPNAGLTATELKYPAGMEMNASGEMLVADSGHNVILKLGASGSSVFAGSPTAVAGVTGDGGAATSALLNNPRGLAYVPSKNTLYVADTGNHRVRMIDGTGTIYNVAGGGATAPSATPVAGTSAQFSSPSALAIDSAGNIFVAETGSGRISKIDVDGNVTAIATGVSSASSLAIDRTRKTLWVGAANTLRKITNLDTTPTLATVYTFGGTGAVGNTYNNVYGLAYDHNGNLYAAVAGDTSSSWDRRYYNKVYRIPVDATGSIEPGKTLETLAGNNSDSAVGAYGSVGTATVDNALTAGLAGPGYAGLFLDMSQSSSNTNLSGYLYLTQWNYNNGWGQVVRLAPSTLN